MNNIKQFFHRKIIAVGAAALLLAAALSLLSVGAAAADPGVYLVTATPGYEHPATGVIEDSGQNAGIGQGMTESVLGGQALLEAGAEGSYLTIRFSLMDNIDDVRLSWQRAGEEDYAPIEYAVMQEDAEESTVDMRFAVPDEEIIVRAEFYVAPMGRDVIFFMTFADPVAGEGDFIVSAAPANETGGGGAQSVAGGEVPLAAPDETAADATPNVLLFVVAGVVIVAIIALAGYLVYRRQKRKTQ